MDILKIGHMRLVQIQLILNITVKTACKILKHMCHKTVFRTILYLVRYY